MSQKDLNKYKILETLQTIDLNKDKKDLIFLLIQYKIPSEANDWLDIIFDW